eukprot:gene9952-10107_t
MRDHIRQFVRQLPNSVSRDYLGDMSDAQRVAWSQDLGLTINETLAALADGRVPIRVDVKLVGFTGDGNEALHVADHDLLLYLKSLHNQLDTVALHPTPGHMMIKPEIQFRVVPAFYELAGKVAGAINQAINQGQTSNVFTSYFTHIVPYQDVDKIIEEDYQHGDGTYTIYLLNPPAHAPYAYFYHGNGEVKDACPGSLWTSSKRYTWFDLSANVTFYGPGPGGKGQVLSHSIPLLKHYRKEEIHRAILPDLAALVWSACQHLIWPPLHHGKVQHISKVHVHLIYMVEALTRPTYKDGKVAVAELQQQLESIAKVMGQEVSVTEHSVLFADCDHCVTAYAGALKARTSRDAAVKNFKLSVTHYLDLPELERWLKEWKDALLSEAGVNWESEHGGAQILPVFIFDVPSTEPVLLDGLLQAAVLSTGEVVAVRSRNAKPFATFFGCSEKQMTIDPKQVHRPVLAATIQALYGVADTALSWSQATGKSWSFLWSIRESLSALAAQQYAMAVGYAGSTVHDVAAIHKLAKHYKSTLNPDLVCVGRPEAVKWWLVPAACVFMTLVLTVWRCARGSGSPHPKQYMGENDETTGNAPVLTAENMRKRGSTDHSGMQQADETTEHIENVIQQLPSWQDQLTARGLLVGSALGLLFAIITLKLSLGTAGIIPSLSIAGGLISFAVMRSWTLMGQALCRKNSSNRLLTTLFQPFGLQENAVLQTYILSISSVAFTGGFGTYLTGMGYQAYLNTGGKPRGDPGFTPEAIYDPVMSRIVPYLLLTAVLGVFLLTQLRKLMIIDWRLPFPSGTASGLMLASFHTKSGEQEAMRKVRLLLYTGAASFVFSIFKWILMGTDYGCGFGTWPSFGMKALKYTWNFDWQQNYIGSGMICPHIVNWSMLLGAILSWGIMWPLMEKREGDWYPAGLDPHDFQGLFGYKVFLTIAMLMGEGMYMVLRVLVSIRAHVEQEVVVGAIPSDSYVSFLVEQEVVVGAIPAGKDTVKRIREAKEEEQHSKYNKGLPSTLEKPSGNSRNGTHTSSPVPAFKDSTDDGNFIANDGTAGLPLVAARDDDDDTEHLLEFKETAAERKLRSAVFLREVIPWWLAPVGYGSLAILSTALIPLIYPPVKWYYVLVAYIITPLFALPNSYGTGLTDWDNCSMYGKLVLFIFAAWAGAQGNGVIVGLGICGVVFGATSSAATLMSDFRTGYICLTAPRAMFTAQTLGSLVGAVLSPVAFLLFYNTGQVNIRDGPYPAPFADIYRGMALIGVKGFSALPKYCGILMLAFFLGGMLLCLVRELLPRRYGRFVPSPMAMGLPFYIGAASAIDFWLGSVVMHIWEYINPTGAQEYGSSVGAGLLVGDGLWSIPSSLVAIAGKAPPICMGFYANHGCKLPYCMGFWLGGSERIPS